jgi:hypothetical protein
MTGVRPWTKFFRDCPPRRAANRTARGRVEALSRMDADFCFALERPIATGRESAQAANATVNLARGGPSSEGRTPQARLSADGISP